MADKSGGKTSVTMFYNKPVPMKLFGAWEIDKTPSNCIPRLCTLTITRLVLQKPLGSDITTIMIAVKMQSSKRTLRSNEINVANVNESGVIDVELDLTFSLQYPHFLKRNDNNLQIMLQRRKRYKNRAILGFKTLAGGLINMAEVMQRSNNMDKELELLGNIKELGKNEIIARIWMSSLKSQPVDQDSRIIGRRIKQLDRSADDSDDEDFTSNEEGSDSETVDETTGHTSNANANNRLNQWKRQSAHKSRKLFANNSMGSDSNQQRNLKQKFIALLKKFRLPDSEAFDSEEQYQAALEQQLIEASAQNSHDIDELFEEEDVEDVDDLSDSGQEFDDFSISSTPKPSLRPFFSSCTLVGPDAESLNIGEHNVRVESDSQDNSGPEQTPDTSDTSLKQPMTDEIFNKKLNAFDKEKKSKLFSRDKQSFSTNKDKDKKVSISGSNTTTTTAISNVPFTKERSISNAKEADSSPRKSVMDQLNRIFSSDDTLIPEQLMIVNATDGTYGQIIAQLLERQHCVVAAHSSPDIKVSFTCLVNKIQKFCNCNSRAPLPIKVAVLGSDAFINSVLRFYVETFSGKPPDWQTYLRFYIIPINALYPSQLIKYLGSIDSTYHTKFCNGSWKELLEDHNASPTVTQEIIQRITNYMNGANTVIQVPIAEAMVTYKEKSHDDESLQVFIPFVCDVKVGLMDSICGNHSLDDESQALSSSPPIASLNSHIEKSLSLTSPLSSKDQQILSQQTSVTPPSSPSISANIVSTNPMSVGNTTVSTQVQSTLSLQPSIQNPLSSNSLQNTSGNLNSFANISLGETMDLQIDYWPIALKSNDMSNKKADSSKFTLKNCFRTLHVSRLPYLGEHSSQSLTLSYVTKEKKQKIMRLGKKKEKEREPESKCQTAEGIYRLVCSCKAAQSPLKVIIDGVEWSGVKFFQLTAQWQTQIKFFPVVLFTQYDSNRNANRINVNNSQPA